MTVSDIDLGWPHVVFLHNLIIYSVRVINYSIRGDYLFSKG